MSYKIYSIKSKSNPDLQYIGSTKQSLKKRLQNHKCHYKRYLNGSYNFVTSFDIIKHNDYYIELYCDTATDDRSDAHWLEGLIIRAESCVNKCVPGLTRQEYNKQYYEQNKEYKKKYQKEYRKTKYICECGSRYDMSNRSSHIKTKKHKNFIK